MDMETELKLYQILNKCYPNAHETWPTGGGCTVEVWRAPNAWDAQKTGALWTLTDEYIAVHSSEEAFWDDEQAGGLVYSIGRWLDQTTGSALDILAQIELEVLKKHEQSVHTVNQMCPILDLFNRKAQQAGRPTLRPLGRCP